MAKRRFGLDLIMAYREDTALTEAAFQVLCMNLFLFALFRFLLFWRFWPCRHMDFLAA